MAFIDLDEFIFPKSLKSISEVVDELLVKVPNAAGLGIHWQCFGSNGQATADYSHGVLERFTRRAPIGWYVPPNTDGNPYSHGNCYIKNIVNPRKIKLIEDPHTMNYFENFYTVDENLKLSDISTPFPITANKIAINHYYVKSKEEFTEKINRGSATRAHHQKKLKWFDLCDRNEEFDDGILRYRAACAEKFSFESDAERFNRVTEALTETLLAHKAGRILDLETALTCRALSSYLRGKYPADAEYWKICEATSFEAILKSVGNTNITDAQLLLSELPELLSLPYLAVKDLRGVALQIIPQIMEGMNLSGRWRDFAELDYLQRLLKLF